MEKISFRYKIDPPSAGSLSSFKLYIPRYGWTSGHVLTEEFDEKIKDYLTDLFKEYLKNPANFNNEQIRKEVTDAWNYEQEKAEKAEVLS